MQRLAFAPLRLTSRVRGANVQGLGNTSVMAPDPSLDCTSPPATGLPAPKGRNTTERRVTSWTTQRPSSCAPTAYGRARWPSVAIRATPPCGWRACRAEVPPWATTPTRAYRPLASGTGAAGPLTTGTAPSARATARLSASGATQGDAGKAVAGVCPNQPKTPYAATNPAAAHTNRADRRAGQLATPCVRSRGARAPTRAAG